MTQVIGLDHLYLTVSDMARSEAFYDLVLGAVLEFRKNRFELGGEAHIQYYNRHFGIVLRPARSTIGHEMTGHDAYAPGLHHLCLRVDQAEDVRRVVDTLQGMGIPASEAKRYPDYAEDYWATYFADPDGIRLEVTNYRQERRQRHDHW